MQWQNYYAGIMGASTWGFIGLALITPAPFNLVVFLMIYPVNFGTLILHPKIAKWLANLRDQMWIYIDTAKNALWSWGNSNFQLWFEGEPASVPIYDAWGKFVEWLTFLKLKDAIRHPYYNDKRRIWGIYLKHGDYSFDHKGIRLTEDERKSLSSWSRLFPKGGGWANFTGMWVPHKSSDRSWSKELLPTAEQLQLALEAIEQGIELLNNIPIVNDGIAYPVVKVKRATGSNAIEDELEKSRPIAIEVPTPEPERERQLVVAPLQVIRVPRRKKD